MYRGLIMFLADVLTALSYSYCVDHVPLARDLAPLHYSLLADLASTAILYSQWVYHSPCALIWLLYTIPLPGALKTVHYLQWVDHIPFALALKALNYSH